MNKKPFVLWLMGPTSAGKTTTGKRFVEEMRAANIPSIHYDGDEIRSFFGDTLGFRPEDRLRAVSTCAHLANKAAEAGLNVVVSALTANDDARAYIKENVPGLVLTYLKCPIDVCIERDSRGLYRKAREGKVDPKTLIGLEKPYAGPADPDIVIDTSELAPEESVEKLKGWFLNSGYNF
ncbi:MAG: adenylyl-sulfate kinase [Rhodospirillales bacterium]|nr:adenylyl-sulfate kinase [Rhodospirillales bacterium]